MRRRHPIPLLLALGSALAACGGEDPPRFVPADAARPDVAPDAPAPDAEEDVPGLEVAVDDVPAGDDVAAPDTTVDAVPDAQRPDARADAIVAPDAAVDAAPDASGPPPLEYRSERAEIWLSADGEPPHIVEGRCGRTADTSGQVYIYVPSMAAPTVYAILQPGGGTLYIRCGGRSYPTSGAAFATSSVYATTLGRAVNARAEGGARVNTPACEGPVRVSLYAYGCPVP